MTDGLLATDRLFQALFAQPDSMADFEVASDLDVSSIDYLPFLVHSSSASEDQNSDGLWSVLLNVYLYLEARTAFDSAAVVYDVIKAWGKHPANGVVPGVGGIEEVKVLSAPARRSGVMDMINKQAVQYDGAFELTVRKL